MAFIFEELDSQKTPLGLISLRKRSEPRLNGQILYEVKLGEEFLMSSLFTEAEEQLSKLGLTALAESGHKNDLDIVVGGLGLGYTAIAVLEASNINSLVVVELMGAVIDWHERGLIPVGDTVATDPRSKITQGDFYAMAKSSDGFFAENPEKLAHGIFLDIDHSPTNWLDPENSSFYTVEALEKLSEKLYSGGVFGLWSDDPTDEKFLARLNEVFKTCEAHTVDFPNPLTMGKSSNTVYIATKA